MKLLFVADGRSPIAQNWIRYFTDRNHQVHLVSSFQCCPDLNLDSLTILPVAFSQASSNRSSLTSGNRSWKNLIPVALRTTIRQRLGPYTLPKAARRLSYIIKEISPDLVHAMRIPYEGMLAALSNPQMPLLVSIWGNDFTLHAPSTRKMEHYTKLTMAYADALHSDCKRDLRLAAAWGFPEMKPYIVLPGAGGIQMDIFNPETGENNNQTSKPVIINPRGIRAYVCNDAFFQAIPIVLKKHPNAQFICPAMEGESKPIHWVERLGIHANVTLLPHQSMEQMADLYRKSWIAVSPTTHDGTPNTLLEAMACGCLPVAGDVESLREWITPGLNGILIEPTNPEQIAEAIILGIDQKEFRVRAKKYNLALIKEHAEYSRVMDAAEKFYQLIVD